MGDVVRLGDPLEGLDVERELAAVLGLDDRHFGLDHGGCHCTHANAVLAEDKSPIPRKWCDRFG